MSEPTSAPSDEPRRAELREALLDQLAYLIHEAEALQGVIDRVPEPVLSGRPLESDWSIKETYGLLAVTDEQVYRPWLQQMMAEDTPHLEAPEEEALLEATDWNACEMTDLLDQVQASRTKLLDLLRALPPDDWTRTAHVGEEHFDVYALAHHITQRDARLLRQMGHRLHEANLTEREEDLPK